MAQDKQGYIWAGSLNGLFRYDGDRFQRFGITDGLPDGQVAALAVTRDGSVWAGTSHGLAVFREGRFRQVEFGEAVGFRYQTSLTIEPRTGDLWLATTKGAAKIDAHHFTDPVPRAHFLEHFPRKDLNTVGFAADGCAWFGDAETLYRWNNGRLWTPDASDLITKDDWNAILADSEGTLWGRSVTHLVALRPGKHQFVREDQGLAEGDFGSLGLDSRGQIAVPTVMGVAFRDAGGWRLVGSDNGLPMNSVSSVLVDREGSPWIGTNGGGVARWVGFGAWENWTAPAWLQNDAVWAIAEDPKGGMWIGTDAGVVKLPDSTSSRFPLRPYFTPPMAVRSLVVGRHEDIWVGTHHEVYRCDAASKACSQYSFGQGLASSQIQNLAMDEAGRLWVATSKGVYVAQTDEVPVRFKNFDEAGGPQKHPVTKVILGREGQVVAAGPEGIWIRGAGVWRHITPADGLLDQDVSRVALDSDGTLSIAYAKNLGVSQLRWSEADKKPKITQIAKNNSLRSRFIYCMTTGQRDALWLGTDTGAEMFSDGQWTHYAMPDGLAWNDFNTDSIYSDSHGGLWFGTSKGLSHFEPARQKRLEVLPVPLVTAIRVLGQSRSLSRPVTIPYHSGDVSLRFSSLSFLSEASTQFRYRLVGLDQEWHTTDQRELHLVNLPPGSYTFQLIARTARGLTSREAAEVQLLVETPWWRTRLFYILSVIALLAAGRAVWLWRMRSMFARQKELEAVVNERTQELMAEQKELLRTRATLQEKLIAEEALKRAAEQATWAKSAFLANMSHEIRTPINGIMGMTQLALEAEPTAEQYEYLSAAKASADALLSVINDILDFSKIEAHKLHLDCIPFNLRDALGDALRAVAVRAHEKEIELDYEVDNSAPAVVVGDPGRVRQIVLNLVGNSIKFTHRGEITLSVGVESIAAGNCRLLFAVRDSGIGIAPENQGLVFEAFSQADGSTTRRYGGTGLGLSISRQLVELMNGTIWMESELGAGTTFFFTAEFGTASDSGDETPRLDCSGLKVLIVDNHPTNCRILEAFLKRQGMVTALASDGSSALALLEDQIFDFMLIDVQTPGIEGLAMQTEGRRRWGAGQMKIIVLTSMGQRSDTKRFHDLTIDAYLLKPLKQSELLGVMHGLAVRKSVIDADSFKPKQVTQEAPPPGKAHRTLNILLAEDNLVNQKVASRMLEKQGHIVSIAPTGRQAVKAFEAGSFDVILMDLQMPEMDGLQATTAIRRIELASDRPGRVPIIALTAHAMAGDRERCLAAGMDDFLPKPIQTEALFSLLDRLPSAEPQLEMS